MKNEFERMKKLYQKNLNAEEEFERIKFEYETQKTIYALKQLNLDYTSIKASISGIVTQRFIKTGNTISPNQPAFEIVNFNTLFVTIHVPEAELSKLKKGQHAILKVDALPDEQFSGKIQRISPIIDPQTGTFDVRIRLNNPSRKLKPGMFARISIVYDVHENALLVPKDAVISEDKESSVFVVKDSLVLKQIVETGYQNTTSIEILNGLTLSDTVITMGTSALKDSTTVEIISRK
jgi:membrane fusion protein (multidrug efflux system)